MARKKTVSISTKPSAAAIRSAEAAARTEEAQFLIESRVEGTDNAQTQSPGPIGRAVYGAVYCLSYGVVFSVILLGKIIPGSRLIGRGIHDGAEAAQRSFEFKPEQAKDSASAGLAA